jgi:hypothetical protein
LPAPPGMVMNLPLGTMTLPPPGGPAGPAPAAAAGR